MVEVATHKIMVVEDKEKARCIFKEFLEKRGYEVETHANCEEIFTKVGIFNPHCILLGLKMSGMSGLEFLKVFRESGNKTAVIIISGNANIEIADECQKLGVSDFLLKPIDFDYLNHAILKALI